MASCSPEPSRSALRPTFAARVANALATGLLIDGRGDLPVGSRLETDMPGIGAVPGLVVRVRDDLGGVKLDRVIELDGLALA